MKTNVAGAADCLGHYSSETTVFVIRKAVRVAGWSRSVMCRVVELSFIAVCVIYSDTKRNRNVTGGR